MLIRNNNPSTLSFSAYRYQFRRINHIRKADHQTNSRSNVCLVSRRGSIEVFLRFYRGNAGTFFGLSTVLNSNRCHHRIRQGSTLTRRNAQGPLLRSARHRSFNGNQFSRAQLAGRGQIILFTPTRGLYSAFGFLLATCRKIGFPAFNYLNRISAMVIRMKHTAIHLFLFNLHNLTINKEARTVIILIHISTASSTFLFFIVVRVRSIGEDFLLL